MEIGIAAPISGRVRDVFVARNVQVDAGAPLFRIEPVVDDDADAPAGERVGLGALRAERGRRRRDDRALVDGGGVPARVRRHDRRGANGALAAAMASRTTSSTRPSSLASSEIVAAFTDLAAVAPERRDPDNDDDDMRAPREHLLAYLRSRDVEREGLPQRFADELLRALAHYGVTTLERNDELDAALLRLFTSQQRRAEQLPIVLALLDDVAADADDEPRLRDVLDELIERTQRRYPDIASRPRSLRYRRFDRPHIERARAETSSRMRGLLAALAGPAPDTGCWSTSSSPARFPLLPILADEDPLDWAPDPFPLLEVLTRRYYSIRELGDMRREPGGLLRTSYVRHDRTVHVLAGWVDGGFDDVLGLVAAASRDVAAPDTVVVDLYMAHSTGTTVEVDELREALARVELPDAVRRVAVIASHPSDGRGGVHVPAARQRRRPSVLDGGPGARPPRRPNSRTSRRTSSSGGCTR